MLGCKIATLQITPKACMQSATCCGMESRRKPCMESSRSDAWNQSEGRCTLTRDAIRLRRLQSRVFTDVCKSQNIPHLYDLAREKDDICSIHGYPVKTAGRKWQGEMPSKDHTWSIDHMIACGDGFTVQAYRTVTDQAALDASDHSCIFADIILT